MPSGYSFRPRLWAIALAAAACAAGIALGKWQLRRAEEKRVVLPHASVEGEFLPRFTVYLDNKLNHGRVGYEVITPLKLRDGSNVLVNRGWIAAGTTRDALPEVRTPAGEVRIEGIALAGLPLEPRVIEQHSDLPDGLARDWPAHDLGIEKHQGYALQWYSLAALAVVRLIVLSFR